MTKVPVITVGVTLLLIATFVDASKTPSIMWIAVVWWPERVKGQFVGS
jgi:hypothetical protein